MRRRCDAGLEAHQRSADQKLRRLNGSLYSVSSIPGAHVILARRAAACCMPTHTHADFPRLAALLVPPTQRKRRHQSRRPTVLQNMRTGTLLMTTLTLEMRPAKTFAATFHSRTLSNNVSCVSGRRDKEKESCAMGEHGAKSCWWDLVNRLDCVPENLWVNR